MRVVIAELDGSETNRERDLEIVAMSKGRLRVTSLGVGSYDRESLDWSTPYGSVEGGGVWRGRADALRPRLGE